MIESKLKHLEFIQGAINRQNTSSFLLKSWTITLVSALFALAAKDANINYVLISYFIIPIFWVLDGFYISSERRYTNLYDEVASKPDCEINFSMDTQVYNKGRNVWVRGTMSRTLILFYGASVSASLVVMFLIDGK